MKLFDVYENLVFFDVETTGFNADKDDRIIELAAMRVSRIGGVRQQDLFVKLPAGRTIPEKIVELTGITDEMLLDGVPEERCAAALSEMMDGKTLLIAHNAQFDLNFAAFMLLRFADRHLGWLQMFNGCDYLDTLTVYKDRRSYPHKLANAITTYGLDEKVQNTHRAIDDAAALYEVTRAMEAERDDLTDYVNVFGYNPRYGISGRKLKKVTYKPQRFTDYMRDPKYILPKVRIESGE